MRYELKITLPIYKILYSLAFMVIIVLVSPINSFSGIITAVEPNVALLASVFMADNYYKEYVGERVAVFYRYPIRKKYISMLVRTLLSWLYLLILVAVFYWGFVWWYQPSNFSQIPIWKMYADTLAACAASMFFAGVFSFTVTNAIQKIGIGIGVTFFLWLFLTSTMANNFPFRGQCFKCHCMRTTGCCKSLYYFKTPVDISVVTDCCTDGNIFCFLNVCKIGVEENEYSFCYTR